MAAELVPDRLTPLTIPDLLAVLAKGYEEIMGGEADRPAALAALGAQLCLETGNGEKVHCWNFGNHKKPKNWEGLYTRFKCDEIFDPKVAEQAKKLGPCVVSTWKGGPKQRVVLIPPHPWSEFVAHESAVKGAAGYIRLIALTERYRSAWHYAYAGDAPEFSRALWRARYFTADVEAYTWGLVSIAKKIRPVCDLIVAREAYDIDDDDREKLGNLVALTLRESLYEPGTQLLVA